MMLLVATIGASVILCIDLHQIYFILRSMVFDVMSPERKRALSTKSSFCKASDYETFLSIAFKKWDHFSVQHPTTAGMSSKISFPSMFSKYKLQYLNYTDFCQSSKKIPSLYYYKNILHILAHHKGIVILNRWQHCICFIFSLSWTRKSHVTADWQRWVWSGHQRWRLTAF